MGQIVQDIALLLTQGRHRGQYSLHEATASFTLSPETLAPPHYRVPHRAQLISLASTMWSTCSAGLSLRPCPLCPF